MLSARRRPRAQAMPVDVRESRDVKTDTPGGGSLDLLVRHSPSPTCEIIVARDDPVRTVACHTEMPDAGTPNGEPSHSLEPKSVTDKSCACHGEAERSCSATGAGSAYRPKPKT